MNCFYYKCSDALKRAEDLAAEEGGHIIGARADDSTHFDYEDDEAARLQWSGELAAVRVEGPAGDHLLAWWDTDLAWWDLEI